MPEILLFTKKDCVRCPKIKELMRDRKIPFKEFDVETPDGLAELAFLGKDIRTVPILRWHNGEVVTDLIEILKKIDRWPE